MWRPVGILLALAVAGCGAPRPGASGRTPEEGVARLLENRVWIDESPGAAPGSIWAFLAGGTLIRDSCVETWRLAFWRLVDETTLVWEEDAAVIRAEIALIGPDELALVLDLADGTAIRSLRAAEVPSVCP